MTVSRGWWVSNGQTGWSGGSCYGKMKWNEIWGGEGQERRMTLIATHSMPGPLFILLNSSNNPTSQLYRGENWALDRLCDCFQGHKTGWWQHQDSNRSLKAHPWSFCYASSLKCIAEGLELGFGWMCEHVTKESIARHGVLSYECLSLQWPEILHKDKVSPEMP